MFIVADPLSLCCGMFFAAAVGSTVSLVVVHETA